MHPAVMYVSNCWRSYINVFIAHYTLKLLILLAVCEACCLRGVSLSPVDVWVDSRHVFMQLQLCYIQWTGETFILCMLAA